MRGRRNRQDSGDVHGRGDMRGDELRGNIAARLELRQPPDGAGSNGNGPGTLHFYAAVYGVASVPLLGFRERIAPGCFDRTCEQHDIRGLFNHDANYVLGRSRPSAGDRSTLSLYPRDSHGLRGELPLPDTQFANDLAVTIDRGDVDQCSFGFSTIRDSWDYSGDALDGVELPDPEDDDDDSMFGAGGVLRDLLEVRLYDVSVVTFPAYPQTTADVRSHALDVARRHRGTAEHRTRLARLALSDLSAREPAA